MTAGRCAMKLFAGGLLPAWQLPASSSMGSKQQCMHPCCGAASTYPCALRGKHPHASPSPPLSQLTGGAQHSHQLTHPRLSAHPTQNLPHLPVAATPSCSNRGPSCAALHCSCSCRLLRVDDPRPAAVLQLVTDSSCTLAAGGPGSPKETGPAPAQWDGA